MNARQNVPRLISFAIAALLLCGLLASQLHVVDAAMPYPQHGDEKVVMVGAQRILESGDWDSRVYAYGSLPIYLDTLCLGLGVIMKSGIGPHALSVREVGRLFGPFYAQPAVAIVARNVWVLLGIACMLVCAALAYRSGGSAAMLIVILCFGVGDSLRVISARYVNVDVPMCLFACWSLFYLTTSQPTGCWRVLPVALLTGATIASKYTGFVVLVPAILWIWLYADRPMLRSGQLFAFTAFAFLCFCPYFLFRFPQYIDAIAAENYHYRMRGHRGFDVAPGLPQVLAYARELRDDYGLGLFVLAAVGVISAIARDWRRGILMLSLPLSLLAFLSTYKVHFARNGLVLEALFPVFAALGILAVWRACTRGLARLAAISYPRELGAALVVLAIAPTLPIERALASHRPPFDSRTLFGLWAGQHLPTPCALIVPTAFAISPETLPPGLTLQSVDLSDVAATRTAAQPGSYMLLPDWNRSKKISIKRVSALRPGLDILPQAETIVHFDGKAVVPVLDTELSNSPGFSIIKFRE